MKAADKKVQDELEALKSKHGGKEFNAQALKKEEVTLCHLSSRATPYGCACC